MAGFLRKKSKPEPTPTNVPPAPVSAASPSSPPLFARFATTAPQNGSSSAGQRMVSQPMALGGRNVSVKAGSAMASTSSFAAGSREAEMARRTEAQVYETSPQPRLSLDKPLPPASQSIVRRATANRVQGPPTSFQPPLNGARSRASMDMRELDNKPLPRPGSAQGSYGQGPPSSYASKIPPKRNASVSAVNTPQIGKMQQNPPTTDADNFAARTVRAPASRQEFIAQDTVRDRNAPRVTGESQQGRQQNVYGTPMSDRAVDLPPEFALFQEFSQTFSSPATNSTRLPPPDTLKSTEQVPGSSQQRSSIYRENNLLKPQPPLPPVSNDGVHKAPAPLPTSNMGASTSHAVPNGVLAPSYKGFSQPQVLAQMNAPTTTYDRANNVMQQHPPSQQHLLSRSGTQPPMPAGGALPANYASFPARSEDGVPARAKSSVSSFHQQETQQEKQQSRPLLPNQQRPPIDFDRYPQMGQSSSQPVQAQLRKTPSAVASASPMKGKPRIFAAMEGQEGRSEAVASGMPASPPQHQTQQLQPQRQQHQYQYQSPPSTQLPLPTPGPVHANAYSQHHPQQQQSQKQQYYQAPVSGYGPQYVPPRHPNQAQLQGQPPQLLPSAEVFSTPRSRINSLPHEDEYAAQVDPRPSAAAVPYMTPPSPKSVAMQALQAEFVPYTPRSNGSVVSLRGGEEASARQHKHVQQQPSPQNTPRSRKLSKARVVPQGGDAQSIHSHSNGSTGTLLLRTGTNTPEPASGAHVHQHGGHRTLAKSQHHAHGRAPSVAAAAVAPPPGAVVQVETPPAGGVGVGVPLDDDPFARDEGVRMLKPTMPQEVDVNGVGRVSPENVAAGDTAGKENGAREPEFSNGDRLNGITMPLTPPSPEDYRQWRKERRNSQGAAVVENSHVAAYVSPPPPLPLKLFPDDLPVREPFTLTQFVGEPHLLAHLLGYLTYFEWSALSAVSKEIRILFVRVPALRDEILNAYLKPVGYTKWAWDDKDPLPLSLQDLSDYMRGISTPTHEYARVAAMHVHSLTIHPNHRDPSLIDTVRALTASARAYNRVVLRLRAQAEKEATVHAAQNPHPPPSSASSIGKIAGSSYAPSRPGTASRPPSRAPSPTSMYSYSQHGNGYPSPNAMQPASSQTSLTFRSPLFRLRRAPLLRVFVPSPEGDWLSDKSVLECEAELKRAGIAHLVRLGDVIWDVAVGDEGNVGRLVWDGSYLIDLDYTYSTIGDLPKYLPTLAFPPSYFHRVIRTGASNTNPIVHIDISPWGEEIALNLQLLQDRVRTETPQGAYHNVVRWVHRSSFNIRPSRSSQRHATNGRQASSGRIPIPDSNNLFVDPGWYGTIIVETEGTNEALADLQDRCGPGAFPPRPRGANQPTPAQIENRKVYRILREKSRPGEIWMKAVGIRERLL